MTSLLATVFVTAAGPLLGQVCRLSVAGLNRNRAVMGPVNTECPGSIHSAPFGNWGVTSNFGRRVNGRQFEGWCRDLIITDNTGRNDGVCGDGRFEWNSCTSHANFSAPNCTLFNSEDCRSQVTTTGVNIVGTQTVEVAVGCPIDVDGDDVADLGGCADVGAYSHGTNFMSVYELDPLTGDELVQTLIFPDIALAMTCGPLGCPPTGSGWFAPAAYDDPVDKALIFAEMAVATNGGEFDARGACPELLALGQPASAASYAVDALAPDSIASVFGQDLAVSKQVAKSLPLPKALGGVVVEIIDSAGAALRAGMLFVSGGQVNFVVPGGVAEGPARVRVRTLAANRVVAAGRIEIRRVAPGIFTANASGRGVAAGLAVYLDDDGRRETELLFECTSNGCASKPLRARGRQIFLTLFGVGFRGRASLEDVEVRIGGKDARVLYAGPQSQFEGLDQLNFEVTGSLSGVVDIEVAVEGIAANSTLVRFE